MISINSLQKRMLSIALLLGTLATGSSYAMPEWVFRIDHELLKSSTQQLARLTLCSRVQRTPEEQEKIENAILLWKTGFDSSIGSGFVSTFLNFFNLCAQTNDISTLQSSFDEVNKTLKTALRNAHEDTLQMTPYTWCGNTSHARFHLLSKYVAPVLWEAEMQLYLAKQN